MPYCTMPEVLFITPAEAAPHEKPTFLVHWARVRSQDHLERFLSGAAFPQLNQHAILEHGEVVPPDGTPLQDFEPRYPVIKSFEEALATAKAARTNPKSVLQAKRFPPGAPIYFVRKGHPAESHG